MRALLAVVMLTVALPQAAEASIRVRLQATVAASCDVAEVSVHDGRLSVLTVCNAERFHLYVRTAEGPLVISAATSPDAAVQVTDGMLGVTSRTPGAQRFVMDTDMTDLSADMIVVEALPA